MEYYKDQTKNILNNVLNYLTENPGLKFIWTEISFFDLWWTDLNPVDRERVKMYTHIPFADSVNKDSYEIVFRVGSLIESSWNSQQKAGSCLMRRMFITVRI